MSDTIRLWPAQALFLLKPNLTNGLRTIRVALLSLLAKGALRIEEQKEMGVFRTKKVPCLRVVAAAAPPLPPHLTAVIDLVRAAQTDGGMMRGVVQRAEKELETGQRAKLCAAAFCASRFCGVACEKTLIAANTHSGVNKPRIALV